MRMLALLLILLAPLQAHAENKVSPAKVQMVMQRTVEDVIRPGYAKFEQAANALASQTSALCSASSLDNLEKTRAAFRDAALAWAGVEFIRFGPVTAQDRTERLLFFPDRKGAGLKQVQEALAGKDKDVTAPETLAKKSVAIQGLGALEFVLFGEGSDALGTGEPHRCGFAGAIAANVQTIASALVAGWAPGSEAAKRWTVGDDPKEAAELLNQIVGTLVHGLDAVRDIRLTGFVDVKGTADKPKQALYWRSELTGPALAANLAGLRLIFEESAIEGLLPADVASIADSIRFEFNQVVDLASPLKGSAQAMLADKGQRAKLVLLDTVLDSLVERIDQQFAPATGLNAGFSFSDGD